MRSPWRLYRFSFHIDPGLVAETGSVRKKKRFHFVCFLVLKKDRRSLYSRSPHPEPLLICLRLPLYETRPSWWASALLFLVCKSLMKSPHETLKCFSLKASFKTAFLLVLTSAERLSPSCTLLCGPTLQPNPSFVLRIIRSLFRLLFRVCIYFIGYRLCDCGGLFIWCSTPSRLSRFCIIW